MLSAHRSHAEQAALLIDVASYEPRAPSISNIFCSVHFGTAQRPDNDFVRLCVQTFYSLWQQQLL